MIFKNECVNGIEHMSRRFSEEEIAAAYQVLKSEQSPTGAVLGALLGVIPAAAVFGIFAWMGGTLIWLLFLPAGLIGFQSAYLGRTYAMKYRIIPAVIAVLIHATGLLFIFQTQAFYLVTLPLSFIVAMVFSKRKLSNVQETALWKVKNGVIPS